MRLKLSSAPLTNTILVHAPFHAVGILKTRPTPTPGLVGAFVGKLSLSGIATVVVGRGGVWQLVKYDIHHAYDSIDFIYNSDAQIAMISYKSTPLTRLSRICLYVCATLNKLIMRDSRDL